MNGKTGSDERFQALRKKAEEIISAQKDSSKDPLDSALFEQIHELHTFQIELELQTEELVRTQQALMRSQMHYTDLYDNSPVGYITLDIKGLILKANLKFAEMLSVERAALINQRLSQYIAFEDKDTCYHHLLNASNPDNHFCELHLKRKDGGFIEVQFDTIVIPFDDRSPDRYRIAVSDIRHRKQMESALQNTRLQLESIFNNMDSYIYITDIKTNKILFVNKALDQLFGKDLIGGVCWERFRKMETTCEFCTHLKLVDADGNATGVYVWDFYNSIVNRWFESHDMAIPWTDGHLVHLKIAVDISRRKELEAQLKDANELLESKVNKRTASLNETNSALKVLLNNLEEEKKEIGNTIIKNYKLLLNPIIHDLKKTLKQKKQEDLIDILESRLKNILSPFSKQLFNPLLNLTPTEIHVAELIRFDKSNKEIADLLDCSIGTIARHRENIRKKLNLTNRKLNLKTYLSSLR
jgi:PAS domain S-box-containing protein